MRDRYPRLEHDGHEVAAVEDASLVLKALVDKDFVMLLCDFLMLELDGTALAPKVTKDYPG